MNRITSSIRGMHADFIRIFADFSNLFGEEGEKRFNEWVSAIGMDTSKPYTNQAQLYECLGGVCESYDWAKPLIQYLKKDTEHKYYKVRALTASISMNKNDYTDLAELERSARTLTGVPLNINHDPSLTLPFPESRVEWAEYEDKSVEAIIRIHNAQEHIQRAIENGDIVNPSIEGDPRGGAVTEDGRKVPRWYHFTALALLEKDVTLPGVPATYGFEPLFLNESLGRSLVESLSVESKTEKETNMTEKLEEGQGINGLELCGQCRYFTLRQNTTENSPASTGDPGSDNAVSRTTGAVGKGIGVCSIDGELKKRDDPACTDGRVREEAVKQDRSMEGRENTIEEMILKSRIEELNEKILRLTQEKGHEIEANVEVQKKLVEAVDKNVRLQNDLSVEKTKNTRMAKNEIELEEKLSKVEDDMIRLSVRADGLEKDVTLYKGEASRLEATVETLKKTTEEMKDDLTRALTQSNDDSTKRASANQRAINAEESKARAIKEVAILTERVSILTRELSDSVTVRAETAKRSLVDQRTITELREKAEELTGVIRDLKRQLSKKPRVIEIDA